MFYLVEIIYIGTNRGEEGYTDLDALEARTSPAISKNSKEICTYGFCDSCPDWVVFAHGEYDSLEEVREHIKTNFGTVRTRNPDGGKFVTRCADVVEVYKSGEYCPMGVQYSIEWVCKWVEKDIDKRTTHERMYGLISEYESEANKLGYTLPLLHIYYFMIDFQQGLQ